MLISLALSKPSWMDVSQQRGFSATGLPVECTGGVTITNNQLTVTNDQTCDNWDFGKNWLVNAYKPFYPGSRDDPERAQRESVDRHCW